MEEKKTKERVYITGHRNPDTDSICSAIAYAELKRQTGCPGREYIAYRAGRINEETKYVLEHFGVEPPQYIETVQPEIVQPAAATNDVARVLELLNKSPELTSQLLQLLSGMGTQETVCAASAD